MSSADVCTNREPVRGEAPKEGKIRCAGAWRTRAEARRRAEDSGRKPFPPPGRAGEEDSRERPPPGSRARRAARGERRSAEDPGASRSRSTDGRTRRGWDRAKAQRRVPRDREEAKPHRSEPAPEHRARRARRAGTSIHNRGTAGPPPPASRSEPGSVRSRFSWPPEHSPRNHSARIPIREQSRLRIRPRRRKPDRKSENPTAHESPPPRK